MIGERAQHRRQLVDAGAAAAELLRHARLDQAGRLQQSKIVRDEPVFVGALLGALGEDRPELARGVDDGVRRCGG